MDILNRIRKIIDGPFLPADVRWNLILKEIAKDDNALTYMMIILNEERRIKKELIHDASNLISKAGIALDTPTLNRGNFIQKEISAFYEKHKNIVSHQYK